MAGGETRGEVRMMRVLFDANVVIVTRNLDHFEAAPMPVLIPPDALARALPDLQEAIDAQS